MLTIASAALSDDAFLTAFNNCMLPDSSFRHGDHLRLAWIQLHRHPFGEALAAVREGIRNFAAHNGMPNLFHETITTAWVSLLATHHEQTFEQFIAGNEHRLNRELLHRFWTPSVLESDAARSAWLPPDRAPLPPLSCC
jgi:hypothetical protein